MSALSARRRQIIESHILVPEVKVKLLANELDRLTERVAEQEKVIRDLVELKDMKDRLRRLHETGHGTDYTEYHKAWPRAWAAARAALEHKHD